MNLTGTYEQSYSWFELSLLRDGKEVRGSRYAVQNNVHGKLSHESDVRMLMQRYLPLCAAGQYFKSHSNTLRMDHPLVRAAKPGDRIVLWVRAKYPVSTFVLYRINRLPVYSQGWTNNVQSVIDAQITIQQLIIAHREAALTVFTSPFPLQT